MDYFKIIIAIVCAVVALYFSILIIKEIKPKSIQEKKMECLRFGSDAARAGCLRLLKETK